MKKVILATITMHVHTVVRKVYVHLIERILCMTDGGHQGKPLQSKPASQAKSPNTRGEIDDTLKWTE